MALAAARVAAANAQLRVAEPRLRRNQYEWQLLDLAARTLAHKVRMGRLFDRVANWQRGREVLDDQGRAQARDQIDRLKNEWAVLREETRALLAKTSPPTCAAALADVKFETDAFTSLQAYQRLLMEAEQVAQPQRYATPKKAPDR
jgi:hypothetical protein